MGQGRCTLKMAKNVCMAAALMALSFFGCDIQGNLIYFPEPTRPSEQSLSAVNLRFWPTGGVTHRGIVAVNEVMSAKGTVIVFHGNAGRAYDREFYVRMIGPLGYRVILAEYPGYGGRLGKPGEKVFVNDALETLDLAFEMYGGPIYLLGESLGCAVAAAAAGSTSIPVEGLILITPWDSLVSVARTKAPDFIVRLILKDRYDSVANLVSFRKKVAIIAAELDDIIPVRHAETLYRSLTCEKQMWTIRGAGHNDWSRSVDPLWFEEIMDFVGK